MRNGQSKESIEYKKTNKHHSDRKRALYVFEETYGKHNIDCAPEKKIKCNEVRDRNFMCFKKKIQFFENSIGSSSGDFVGHQSKYKF